MNRIRYPRFLLLPLILSAGILLPVLAVAAEEDVSKEDPARWYQADDTAQLHYRNLVTEAHAAGRQALQECKPVTVGKARNDCRIQAREYMRRDLARAKRIYKATSGSAAK